MTLAALPSDDPKSDGRYGEEARENHKPNGEVGDGVVSRLFPKIVLMFLLGGGLIGLLVVGSVVLWGHIQYAPDKATPQRKTHQKPEERPH